MGVPVDGVGFEDSPLAQDPFAGFDLLAAWPLLVVVGLALLATGWLVGRMAARPPEDNANAIWSAISKSAAAALEADNADLSSKAEALRKVLDQKLGGTARLIGGRSDLRQALEDALEGKPHAPSTHGDDHGHKDHGDQSHGDGHAEPAAAPTTQVIINTGSGHDASYGSAHGSGHGHGSGHAPAHMSPREQQQALRLAVSDLNQHWRQEAARKAELRAAHRELSASRRFPSSNNRPKPNA